MKLIASICLLLSSAAMAATPIGNYDISREFNVHQGLRAEELGFPLNPSFLSMSVYRENVLSQPVFEISYRLTPRGPILIAKGSGQILKMDSDSAVIQLVLSRTGEEGGSCGPMNTKTLNAIFRFGLQGEFANGHRFVGIHEWTNDSCHESHKIEEITYTIDE